MPNTDPTIYDVSKLAGVSIATVSRVLNSPNLVSSETKEKVLWAIEQLGYVPKVDARERARKEIGRIGVVTPFFTLPSFSQRLRGIAAALIDSPYNLSVYPVNAKSHLENYYTMLPYSYHVDGLIIVSLPIDEKSVERFIRSKIPVIFIENCVPNFSSIEIDNYEGGKLAALHFINKGHSHCAYVGNTVLPEYTLRPEEQRLAGYRDTLRAKGIDLPEAYIKLPVFPPKDQTTQINELFDLKTPPTAIFSATDDLALQVLKVARDRGLQIPDELAVIGFDNIDIAEYLELTTISQSLCESGELAARRLLAEITNPLKIQENTFIQLKLIQRSTT
ncbi:MAG: LacI family DNA-binding transcriptional regulator [Anaerolineales bacterium]